MEEITNVHNMIPIQRQMMCVSSYMDVPTVLFETSKLFFVNLSIKYIGIGNQQTKI